MSERSKRQCLLLLGLSTAALIHAAPEVRWEQFRGKMRAKNHQHPER
jgi:hypothetical protein